MPKQLVHKHTLNHGGVDMVTKTSKIGNATIRIHSPNGIIAMSPEEQQAWFEREWEKGNPRIVHLVNTVLSIYEEEMEVPQPEDSS